MDEIRFYHLKSTSVQRALLPLLERVLERNWRAVILTGSKERVEALNGYLWTYADRSFLPHGSAMDGNPSHHPIWLTDVWENPNCSNVVFLEDGAKIMDNTMFNLCCELFDGNDLSAVELAQQHWKDYLGFATKVSYWQQTLSGNWELNEMSKA